jgi:quinolinate synthase
MKGSPESTLPKRELPSQSAVIGSDLLIDAEATRLFRLLLHVDCEPGRTWNFDECRRIAPLTLEINRLKREKDAVILTHSYVEPEIVYGVGDFKGDSYFLSLKAREAKAKVIVFAGVVFMAETAKILSPDSLVVVPDRGSGCSLADSLTGDGLRRLKAQYPDAVVVCYINSTADVKAESDVCVTSGNVYDIVAQLPQQRVLFVPDRLMGENVRAELQRRGVAKELITSDGTCIVHDVFDAESVGEARARFPGLKVVAHPECTPAVAAAADFVGSTGAMMKYVKNTPAPYFLMLTECGLVGRLQVEDPEKRFIGGCRLCPYMKLNSLEKIRDALAAPRADQIVTVDDAIRLRAARCIERMFELTPKS